MSYKNLSLKRDCIVCMIQACLGGKYDKVKVSQLRNINNTLYRVDVSLDRKDFFLDFYFKSDGKTTISITGGKQNKLKVELAEYLKRNCGYKCNKDSFVINNMLDDDLELLVMYLLEPENKINIIDEVVKHPYAKRELTFTSDFQDQLKLIHYNTNRVQIQGKPLYIFSKAVSLISELRDDVRLDALEDVFEVRISKEENYRELEGYLPNAYSELNDKLKRILHSSIALKNSNVEAEDYSFLAFPALRAVEGHLREKLSKAGFESNGGRSFGFFNIEASGSYVLSSRKSFPTDKHKTKIEETYSYWNKQRHAHFHMDELYTNAIIGDKTKAVEIVDKSILLIDEYYAII
ncbi:type II toxin-antitoxin system mRNA endoribonuclease LsoA [Gottschalkiaceae bacterium SANA]|nr:type II toxin-antitoxin system mRNA endoribonuclease LsoA [Gottschalkiaceae bacterium SANA]